MRYVPTLGIDDPQDYGPARDYTDPADVPVGTCQDCGELHMELDSDGLCEPCTERRVQEANDEYEYRQWRQNREGAAGSRDLERWLNLEWIRDRTGESSESAVYVDNIPF